MKSFRPRDGDPPSGDGGRNPEVDFRSERHSNETHQSTTDPDARLAKKGKGKEARLCFGAHVLMDNREGLVVDVLLTPAAGAAEREAALDMLARAPGQRRITVGADRGYDTRARLPPMQRYAEKNAIISAYDTENTHTPPSRLARVAVER